MINIHSNTKKGGRRLSAEVNNSTCMSKKFVALKLKEHFRSLIAQSLLSRLPVSMKVVDLRIWWVALAFDFCASPSVLNKRLTSNRSHPKGCRIELNRI